MIMQMLVIIVIQVEIPTPSLTGMKGYKSIQMTMVKLNWTPVITFNLHQERDRKVKEYEDLHARNFFSW